MLVPEYNEPTNDDFAFEDQVDADDVINALIPAYGGEAMRLSLMSRRDL